MESAQPKEQTVLSSKKAKDRTITLTVKASDLWAKGPSATQKQIDKYTKIENDGGKEAGYGDDKKNFNTNVWKEKHVTWDIVAKSPNGDDNGYEASIVSISQKDGSNTEFFKGMPLKPKSYGPIKGKVEKGDTGDHDHYSINFCITNFNVDKNRDITFSLDPKLSIEKSGN